MKLRDNIKKSYVETIDASVESLSTENPSKKKIKTVIKRGGAEQKYSSKKIKKAIIEAYKSVGQEIPDNLFRRFSYYLGKFEDRVEDDKINVEDIQDVVEFFLMKENPEVAKQYIIYRENHKNIREFVNRKKAWIERYKGSSNTANATIDDNSNVTGKNVGIINAEIHKEDNVQISRGMVMSKLKELYPDCDCKNYLRDLENHIIYKHDESSFAGAIAPYCVSVSMYEFLMNGLKHIGGLSAAPNNLDSYCGLYINLIFAIAGQFAGAVATSEFLLYFDYFARKQFGQKYYEVCDEFAEIGHDVRRLEKMTGWSKVIKSIEDIKEIWDSRIKEDPTRECKYSHEATELAGELCKAYKDGKLPDNTRTIKSIIHQKFQQVVYSINQPAAARGMQAAFVNFSYFDKPYFDSMFGSKTSFMFPDFTTPVWESLNWLQKDFMMWFNEERLHTVITFPVESFALIYKNGKFEDEENAKFVAEELARGHSFFVYISDTADSLSSCCRLKNKIQKQEFSFTNGNMSVETGSKSVITLNLNRIVQDYCDQSDFGYDEDRYAWYKGWKKYLGKILDRVYKYHEAYNELLYDMYDAGLLQVYSAGFIALEKQYLTIGLNGLSASAEFLGMKISDNDEYAKYCEETFGYIKELNKKHGTKKLKFNTEQIPGEGLAVKNYNWDKADGYWVPEDINLYTSYIYRPYDDNLSMLEKIRMHGSRFIGDYLDGGAAAHLNISEHLSSQQYYDLLKYAGDNGCQYLTWNCPNSECTECGWIGKTPVDICPCCGSKKIDQYDRIIGYLTRIKNWSEGRQIEQKHRVYQTSVEAFNKN